MSRPPAISAEHPRLRRLLLEPPRPRSVAERPNAYWYAVATVCFGAFMGQLDSSIVTLAFPTLGRTFHSTVGGVQWVGLAYLLTLVATLTAVGRYADMAGRKLLYTYGFVVFIVGSLLCGLAPSLPILIGMRVLQAIGAAMLQANSVAIIVDALPKEKLGRGIGVQGAAQALGLALGPVIGGLLISLGGWRLIFFVNVPVGIVATVLAWLLIPRSRHLSERVAFDWLGLALFAPIGVALMLAISLGGQAGWSSPFILAMFAAAALLAFAFVAHESRRPHPMVDLALLRIRAFWTGIAGGWLIYLVIFGVLFVVPYLLEEGMHYSTARAGLELLAMPLAIGVTAPLAGRLAERTGAQPLIRLGMSVTGGALVLASFFHGSLPAFIAELAAIGIGLGASTAPNNAATMGALPATSSGVGSGLLNMARGLGTAIGLALTGLVFTAFGGSQLGDAAAVGRGFHYATLFLAAVSFAVVGLAALRGNGALSSDPSAQVE